MNGMKRRSFLKSALGGGAALAGGGALGLARPARAGMLAPLERAGIAPVARLAHYDGAHPAGTFDLPLVAGGTARGQLGEAVWSCALRIAPVKSLGPKPARASRTSAMSVSRS